MSGRITTYMDKGLGWTRPVVVACCRTCGTELARNTKQHAAERTARRTRCPTCGTRAARRLPGTTSLTTDLAAARRQRPHDRQPTPRLRRAGRR
jgi:DNA-directed RNA polymerase subunit RPC12/RpoP